MASSPVASAAAPAASSWSVASSAPPLAFRKDADEGFPLGGAILLVVLMATAVWAWWYGRMRGGSGRLPALLAGRMRPPVTGGLRIVESVHAAGGLRLLVVEWAGGRRVLVGANGQQAPVTLDVVPHDAGHGHEAP